MVPALYDVVEEALDLGGDGARAAAADAVVIYGAHRHDLGAGTAVEDLLGDVELGTVDLVPGLEYPARRGTAGAPPCG